MKLDSLYRGTPLRWAIVTGLVLLATMICSEWLLERYFRASDLQNKRLQTTQQLTLLGAELSGIINNNLSLISGLSAHIGIHPEIEQGEFSAYVSSVFRQQPLLVNMAAAPNNVVRFIHPLEGNRTVLEADYRDYPRQWEDIKTLTERGAMHLTGPFELIQGQEAVIGRTSVFTRDDQFWGIVSAPIYTQDLYRAAGLSNPNLPLNIAIRWFEENKTISNVFYGDPQLFADPLAVTTLVDVRSGQWQIVAAPKNGWANTSGTVWLLRASFAVLTGLLLLLVFYRYHQSNREYEFQQALAKKQILLSEVGKLALVGGWQISRQRNELKLTLWDSQTASILNIGDTDTPPSLSEFLGQFGDSQGKRLSTAIEKATLGDAFDLELSFTGPQREKRWARVLGKPLTDYPLPYPVLGSLQDITQRKRFTNKIQQQAIYDQLTGLPNRLLFYNRLSKAIERAQREKSKLAILFIDLDNFKPVNDNLGHSIGDKLLKEVGQRIKNCIRASDTVARYSGDEFIVILHDVHQSKVPVYISQEIIDAISASFTIDGKQIFCGASVGISIFPDDSQRGETLVSNADQAMYEVKRSGRNGWQFFTPTMQIVSEKRHQLSNKLAAAIINNEFTVYYQPIIDLNTNRISKCEALVRWVRNGKQIATDEFIALAEETGRINEIDRFVLATATDFVANLTERFNYPLELSVNVSPRIFSCKDDSLNKWLELITNASRKINVTVEMTERLLIEESERIMWVLTKLKAIGVTIAIDDFGTGYSSLSYLTKFPIDIIKIDQSFIRQLGQQTIPESLTEAMIGLCHKLSLDVVAEGIETPEQLSMLKLWQCDFGQGYYFDRPLDAEVFSERIRTQSEAKFSHNK
ncbi:EAL domain-containing protein [Gilvimarinus xylanilyticus]|uniref:EAL domain-containing protein n=1 Tax=Gilvimarinus xylanilyticus TaxID=2944139 RepID=A0A9X2KUS4_9GAMM|nr:EAL domain-containing protein [Gilvimarinus xylanilyticus]MCP8900507.1 EAL domain-containing protein [Gilvimarinus xylanilyticus]